MWQRYVVEKQDNGKLIVVLLFGFDCDVRWGASVND